MDVALEAWWSIGPGRDDHRLFLASWWRPRRAGALREWGLALASAMRSPRQSSRRGDARFRRRSCPRSTRCAAAARRARACARDTGARPRRRLSGELRPRRRLGREEACARARCARTHASRRGCGVLDARFASGSPTPPPTPRCSADAARSALGARPPAPSASGVGCVAADRGALVATCAARLQHARRLLDVAARRRRHCLRLRGGRCQGRAPRVRRRSQDESAAAGEQRCSAPAAASSPTAGAACSRRGEPASAYGGASRRARRLPRASARSTSPREGAAGRQAEPGERATAAPASVRAYAEDASSRSPTAGFPRVSVSSRRRRSRPARIGRRRSRAAPPRGGCARAARMLTRRRRRLPVAERPTPRGPARRALIAMARDPAVAQTLPAAAGGAAAHGDGVLAQAQARRRRPARAAAEAPGGGRGAGRGARQPRRWRRVPQGRRGAHRAHRRRRPRAGARRWRRQTLVAVAPLRRMERHAIAAATRVQYPHEDLLG